MNYELQGMSKVKLTGITALFNWEKGVAFNDIFKTD